MTIMDATPNRADTAAAALDDVDWIATARGVGLSVAAGVAERDRTGELPREIVDRLRSSHLTMMLVPTEFGGGGVTHATAGAVLRELGRHDGPTAVTLSMHTHVVGQQLWRHRRGMSAEKIFRKVVDDRAVLCTTGASDWVGSSGSVRQVDGGYRVTARKTPVSGCEFADVLVTSFRFEGGADGPQVIHCSLPMSAEGVRVDPTWNTLGMRATGSHTVVLDDVFVPDAAVSLTRTADVWAPVWNVVLGTAMPLIMAAYLGVADAAAAIAVEAGARRADGATIQLVGELTNAHLSATDAIDAMFRDADDLRFDNVDTITARMLSRKTTATESMIDTVRLAAEVVGGGSFLRGSEMERLQRDILGSRCHPLPRGKQLQLSGRVALGLSPVG